MPDPAVAFDITPLQNAHRYRGIGTYVRGLAQRLAAQTEVPIEFWGSQGEQPLDVQSPHTTLLLPRTPRPQYRGAWLFAQLDMRRRAWQSKVRAVHVTDPDALVPLRGRTLLATVYDLIPLKQGLPRRQLVARIGYQRFLAALRKVEVLFAISSQTAGDVKALLGIPPSRIVIAMPGVDLPASGGRSRKRDRPYFLFLGGPNPNKNLSVLLEAMTMCPDLDAELVVGGQWLPKQVAALESQIQARGLSGRARHIGFVPPGELTGLVRDAVALVVPSLHEGFGLPVAEGLAAGAVVIHSRLPVLEATSSGAALTFDPASARELAAVLRRAESDQQLRDDLRARGLRRALELTWDAAVDATLDTYRRVSAR